MKFGLVPINVGVRSIEQMVTLARLAEEGGYESVWTFEHVVVPLDYASRYPYSPSGKMGAEPDTVFVDPLVALSAVAARTTTLKLGTGVNILPQVNPLLLAKQAASLDFVAGGRLLLGLGIGWLREEFAAMGVSFERRGARFDEYLEAMRKVWSGAVVEHDGEHLHWHGFQSHPAGPDLHVVIGGSKGRAFERVARFGQGWFAPTTDTEELGRGMAELRAACAVHGRDPDEVEVTCMWNARGGKGAVEAFADAGAHRLLIPLPAFRGDVQGGIERIAAEVIE